MAPPASALAASRQQRRGPAQFLLLGALCAAVRLTSIAPSACFAVRAPIEQLPVSEWPDAESGISSMDRLLKAPKFLKVALCRRDFIAVSMKRQELEEKADVRLLTAKRGEYYPYSKEALKVVFVAGEEQNVLAALQEILPEDGDANMTTYFIVPKQLRNFLLDNRSERIRKVQDLTSSRMQLDHAGFEELLSVRSRSRAAAVAAAELILEAEAELSPYTRISDVFTIDYLGCSTRGMQEPCHVLVTIPANQTARFIGKNGNTLKSMQKMFGVKLEIDQKLMRANGSSIINISGAISDVHAAHLYVFDQFLS